MTVRGHDSNFNFRIEGAEPTNTFNAACCRQCVGDRTGVASQYSAYFAAYPAGDTGLWTRPADGSILFSVNSVNPQSVICGLSSTSGINGGVNAQLYAMQPGLIACAKLGLSATSKLVSAGFASDWGTAGLDATRLGLRFLGPNNLGDTVIYPVFADAQNVNLGPTVYPSYQGSSADQMIVGVTTIVRDLVTEDGFLRPHNASGVPLVEVWIENPFFSRWPILVGKGTKYTSATKMGAFFQVDPNSWTAGDATRYTHLFEIFVADAMDTDCPERDPRNRNAFWDVPFRPGVSNGATINAQYVNDGTNEYIFAEIGTEELFSNTTDDNELVLLTSTDGETWTEIKDGTAHLFANGTYAYNTPVLFVNGDVLIAVCSRWSKPSSNGNVDLVCKTSVDGGTTWSAVHIVADHVTAGCGYGDMRGGIIRSNGAYLFACDRTTSTYEYDLFLFQYSPSVGNPVPTQTSDWLRFTPGIDEAFELADGSVLTNFAEPTIAELADGKIYLMMRTSTDFFVASVGTLAGDGSSTWVSPFASESSFKASLCSGFNGKPRLWSGNSPGCLYRTSKRLYFFTSDYAGLATINRTTMRMWESEDNGVTWYESAISPLLTVGAWVAYPSVQVVDGRLFVSACDYQAVRLLRGPSLIDYSDLPTAANVVYPADRGDGTLGTTRVTTLSAAVAAALLADPTHLIPTNANGVIVAAAATVGAFPEAALAEAAVPDVPTAIEISEALDASTTGQTIASNLDAKVSEITEGALGSGGIATTVVTEDTDDNPIDGVAVWVTSDVGGSSVVAGKLYSSLTGTVTFMLEAGTWYVWRQKGGVNFTNPQAISILAT
jgi:hypothetical protein